ncbi:hypothetical protein F4801DRAFT_600158 [Xylaria longipes]|nr:hypothetical protein F4801DRAFT_600158 [Xylaria longipes]
MLFSSPYANKIKAPHPPARIAHRGYSGSGKETAYYEADIKSHGDEVAIGQSLRKISDLEESYEIGSELDPVQQNIWLPDDILLHFQSYMQPFTRGFALLARRYHTRLGIVWGSKAPHPLASRS